LELLVFASGTLSLANSCTVASNCSINTKSNRSNSSRGGSIEIRNISQILMTMHGTNVVQMSVSTKRLPSATVKLGSISTRLAISRFLTLKLTLRERCRMSKGRDSTFNGRRHFGEPYYHNDLFRHRRNCKLKIQRKKLEYHQPSRLHPVCSRTARSVLEVCRSCLFFECGNSTIKWYSPRPLHNRRNGGNLAEYLFWNSFLDHTLVESTTVLNNPA
jgi:hypothetical protein